MKTALLFLILMTVSCVKLSPNSLEQKSEPAVIAHEKAQEMPTVQIELADRACEKDSDALSCPLNVPAAAGKV